jgi:hypothetical protein
MTDLLSDVRLKLLDRSSAAHGSADALARELTLALDPGPSGHHRTLQVLKDSPRGRVVRASLAGHDVVIKTRPIASTVARTKHVLRLSQFWRHVHGAGLIYQAGLTSPRPIAVGTCRCADVFSEVLILPWASGTTLLEHLAHIHDARDSALSVREQHAIATVLGERLAIMHLRLTDNRDPKPSNLVVDSVSVPMNPHELIVIDCVGVHRSGMINVKKTLARLMIEPLGCGVQPRRALAMRVVVSYVRVQARFVRFAGRRASRYVCRRIVRHLWRGAARRIAGHGDPTPQVNPLGR